MNTINQHTIEFKHNFSPSEPRRDPDPSEMSFSAISPIQSSFSSQDTADSFYHAADGVLCLPFDGQTRPGPEGPGGADLPCLRKQNSDRTFQKLNRLRDERLSRSRKAQLTLKENLTLLIECFGIDYLAFFTLTFKDNLYYSNKKDQLEANRRWNNLTRRVLNEITGGQPWVVAVEPTKDGRIHFHAIIVCKRNVRQGFDIEKYKNAVRDRLFESMSVIEKRQFWKNITTNQELKGYWSLLRKRLKLYGFGRHELMPIIYPDRMADYIGKYLTKGDMILETPLGSRRLRYSYNWNEIIYEKKEKCPAGEYTRLYNGRIKAHQIAGVGGNTLLNRLGMARLALFYNTSEESIKYDLGRRWGYKFRQEIKDLGVLEQAQFEEILRLHEDWKAWDSYPLRELIQKVSECAILCD